jgi:hypothetical protein
VQLAPQVCVVTSQVAPAAQVQLVPVQLGGLVETLPQPAAEITRRQNTENRIA